ncbi:hypothetical protein ACOMHN_009353 [Nucella lapillus]
MKRQANHADGCEAKTKESRLENRPPPSHHRSRGDTFRLPVDSRQYDQRFPNFRKPVEIGSFSQDAQRTFHHDRRQLRFFVRPARANPGFNLRQGYASFIQKDPTVKEYLDDMLRWVIRNKAKFSLHKSQASEQSGKADAGIIDSLNTDFVCWRGLLTRLLCTPYERQDDWKIAITRFRGTYFLCEFETERKKQREEQMTERHREMSYWGWKFEQYVTAEQEGGRPDTDRPVNTNEGFCSVVRTRLHTHSLVYGGEVDAWDGSLSGDSRYVEMKTTRAMHTQRHWENFKRSVHMQRHWHNFKRSVHDMTRHDRGTTSKGQCTQWHWHNFKRFKLLKWWAQSFLLGIPKIVSGYRDDDGIVHSLQDFLTHNIPSFTEDVHNGWQANVCFNFLDQLLTFIKHSVTLDHSGRVYLMQWSPGRDVELTAVATPSPSPSPSPFSFLPPWFLHWEGWGEDTTSPPTTTTAKANTATEDTAPTITDTATSVSAVENPVQ